MKTSLTFNGDGTASLMLKADTDAEKRMLLILTERPRMVMIEREIGHPSNSPTWVRFDVREAAQEP